MPAVRSYTPRAASPGDPRVTDRLPLGTRLHLRCQCAGDARARSSKKVLHRAEPCPPKSPSVLAWPIRGREQPSVSFLTKRSRSRAAYKVRPPFAIRSTAQASLTHPLSAVSLSRPCHVLPPLSGLVQLRPFTQSILYLFARSRVVARVGRCARIRFVGILRGSVLHHVRVR